MNFDEDYFENRDRKNLYVFLSALYDDEVFDYLQSAYAIAKLEAPNPRMGEAAGGWFDC